jgi:RNA polymerase-binding transcription factor DksA
MDQAKIKAFREQLLDIVARIQPDAQAAAEQTRDPVGLGELSNVPMHLGDRGTEEYLQDLNATLLENQRNLLDEVSTALHRINDGTYGICEGCGRPIPDERLEAIPYTRFCTACAAANPGPGVNLNEGRPRRVDETLAGREEKKRPRAARDTSEGDVHAAGTAGGGTAFGGLAGSNTGSGEPGESELEKAAGSGDSDAKEAQDRGTQGHPSEEPKSGRAGGAVGGTPAGKRTRGRE